MAENTDLAKVPETTPQKNLTVAVDDSSFSSYLDTAKFNQLWRVANVFAGSDIVPDHYKNKPNNCFLALQMATRLEMEPIMFIQNSYVVHGKPGIQAVVIVALVNSRGPFQGPIQWKFEGEGKARKCTAYAVHKVTGETCSAVVSWKMVEAEGWDKKSGSKWLTLPDQMFQYRSATFLARLYCPEVILGLPTADELVDTEVQEVRNKELPTSNLNERLSKKVDSQIIEPSPQINESTRELQPEVDKTPSDPTNPAREAASDANGQNPGKDTPNGVLASERYYCKACDKTFPTPAGGKKRLCRHCLSAEIIDRWESV